MTTTAPQEMPNQDLLKSLAKNVRGILGEPPRQPQDFTAPLYPNENFDGRHASGFSDYQTILPSAVGMDDAKFKTGRRGFLGKPAMDVFVVRPYRPGEEGDVRLQQNPELRSENTNTTYVVLTSNYTQQGDNRGVITRSWTLRDDGLLQTWETWRKWQQVEGWGSNVQYSQLIPNDPENNLDLWNKVITALKKSPATTAPPTGHPIFRG